MKPYKRRRTEFIGITESNDWMLKVYTISTNDKFSSKNAVLNSHQNLKKWLKKAELNEFTKEKLGCLIIHETDKKIFAVLNWWVDENILQNHVFISDNCANLVFKDYSNQGIQFCVWEMAIIWFERNNWIENMMTDNPNKKKYLSNTYPSEYV